MRKKKMPSANNLWNKEGFLMCRLGENCMLVAKIKHFKKCISWSYQRAIRGYSDYDKWNMYSFLQNLIPEMLQDMRDNRHGSPGYLGENYTNDKGILVNDTCHDEWDKLLDHMIFLWKESAEDTCTRKNPYEEEYDKAHREFEARYGFLGEKLQTEEELEENRKRGGGTIHFMDEMPEYKDIWEKYNAKELELDTYRLGCKNEAIDLLKEHFYALWD
ncbi:MAG: hypothetical protein J6I97_04795 [Agathobacter sp.]|nr:hypothetical protein [Agathobacter sp.]